MLALRASMTPNRVTLFGGRCSGWSQMSLQAPAVMGTLDRGCAAGHLHGWRK
jgi:hypothetical protein